MDAGTAAGYQVALVEGENVIKVKVTAANGMATQTYTVTVTRSAVDAPDAPTGFSATKGNRYVTLAWNAPASGANITHHEYHYKTDGSYPDDWKTIPYSAPGGFNEDGFTVTKLTNDTAHTFELRAVNAGGGSTAVESSAVTPSGSGRIVESIGVRRNDGQDGDPYGVGDEIRLRRQVQPRKSLARPPPVVSCSVQSWQRHEGCRRLCGRWHEQYLVVPLYGTRR